MKKLLSLLLAAILALGALAFAEGGETEPVELNIISVFADPEESFYETPVYQEFTKRSGVKLTTTFVTTDKLNVLLAGGDTTDLIAAGYVNYYQAMAEGGLVLPLNDDIAGSTYLNAPERDVEWNLLKSIYDGGNGTIYGVINSIGPQGGNAMPTNHGTFINWEYYKEIGAPELENYYDFIDALEQIVALHPVTENGMPVYAFSLYNEPNQIYPFSGIVNTEGFRAYNAYIYTRFADNTLCYAFLDEDGPYWKAASYMNYAWNKGIVDPDSFTQTNADYTAKFQNGQVLSYYYANGAEGTVVIPQPGTYMQENLFDIGGNVIAIASTCKDPKAAFGMLDYLASPDAGRLIYSGIEGVHWEYNAEGVPEWTEETLACKNDPDAWNATGIDQYALYSIIGIARGVDCGDGGITALSRMPGYFMAGLDDVKKDFTAFYAERDGADYRYPNEVLYARGVMDGRDLNSAITKSYGAAPDDIARIDASLLEMAINAIPELVMASPDDFENVKARVLQSFIDAGAETSYEFWQGRWNELWEQYGQ